MIQGGASHSPLQEAAIQLVCEESHHLFHAAWAEAKKQGGGAEPATAAPHRVVVHVSMRTNPYGAVEMRSKALHRVTPRSTSKRGGEVLTVEGNVSAPTAQKLIRLVDLCDMMCRQTESTGSGSTMGATTTSSSKLFVCWITLVVALSEQPKWETYVIIDAARAESGPVWIEHGATTVGSGSARSSRPQSPTSDARSSPTMDSRSDATAHIPPVSNPLLPSAVSNPTATFDARAQRYRLAKANKEPTLQQSPSGMPLLNPEAEGSVSDATLRDIALSSSRAVASLDRVFRNLSLQVQSNHEALRAVRSDKLDFDALMDNVRTLTAAVESLEGRLRRLESSSTSPPPVSTVKHTDTRSVAVQCGGDEGNDLEASQRDVRPSPHRRHHMHPVPALQSTLRRNGEGESHPTSPLVSDGSFGVRSPHAITGPFATPPPASVRHNRSSLVEVAPGEHVLVVIPPMAEADAADGVASAPGDDLHVETVNRREWNNVEEWVDEASSRLLGTLESTRRSPPISPVSQTSRFWPVDLNGAAGSTAASLPPSSAASAVGSRRFHNLQLFSSTPSLRDVPSVIQANSNHKRHHK